MGFRKSLHLFCIFVCCWACANCTYNPFVANNHTTGSPAGAIVGAGIGAGGVALLNGPKPVMAIAGVGGGMLGYYVTTLRYDAGGIIRAGGKVYKLGDFVGIYIPSDTLFEPNTADLLPRSKFVLDSAGRVLARYPNNNVMISGNTAGFYRSGWDQRLSEKRAQVVAAYLWSYGINDFRERSIELRKLNYVGYGDYFPIAHKYTNDSLRKNSRIQITSYPSNYDLRLDRHMAVQDMRCFKNCGKDRNRCFALDQALSRIG